MMRTKTDAAPVEQQDAEVLPDTTDATDNAMETELSQQLIQDASIKRNASWLDVMYHSITAMVGAGVLGLPAAMSHLGWIWGSIFMLFSYWVSWHTYRLLVYMHEVPDLSSKTGGVRRLDRYDQLAEYVWGRKKGRAVLMPFQLAVLVGIAITYIVVGGDNLAAFVASVAPNATGGKWGYYLMFGGLELLLSMLPSFDDLRFVSLLGALMSATYCVIATVMSATVKRGPHVNYNPAAMPLSRVDRVMGVMNALTTVFFAYGGHNVALETQATIPSHPKGSPVFVSTIPTMLRGVNVTFCITGLCYFGVAMLGFYAFGTGVNENVLMAFEAGPTHWVVAMANMMVVVHVAAAFQVFTQPVFQLMEARICKVIGRVSVPLIGRVLLRVVYVLLLTFVAILVPFFGALMGLIGAIAITPTTFLLPPLLWVMYKRPAKWSVDWAVNWGLVCCTGALGVMGFIASVYIIVIGWTTFKLFAN